MSGSELKTWLISKGISQGKFAKHIGVSKNTVGSWIGGKTEIPKLLGLYLSARDKVDRFAEHLLDW